MIAYTLLTILYNVPHPLHYNHNGGCVNITKPVYNSENMSWNQLPVEKPIINKCYHLSWSKHKGCVWQLISIDGEWCNMVKPKTRKPIRAKLSDLRHTRKQEQELNKYLTTCH